MKIKAFTDYGNQEFTFDLKDKPNTLILTQENGRLLAEIYQDKDGVVHLRFDNYVDNKPNDRVIGVV